MSRKTRSALQSQAAELFLPRPAADQPAARKWNGAAHKAHEIDLLDSLAHLDDLPSTGGSSNARDLDQAPIGIPSGLGLKCFGNSITGHQYYTLFLADYLGSTSRVLRYDAGASTRGNIKRINQDNELPTNRDFIASWMNGINDVRFNNATTNYPFRHLDHVKEFLVNAFAQSIETAAQAQSAGRAYVGGGGGNWAAWDKGLANNGRTNGLKGTGDVAMDFLIPAGVESMAVVFFTNSATDTTENFSTSVRIEVEGQFIENINLANRSQGFDHYTYHLPRTYFETSGGSQIRVINLDTSKSMVIDYGVALKPAKDCLPVIVWDNTYVADELMVPGFTEGGNVVPTGINRAWFDARDKSVRDYIVDNFTFYGYKVAMPRSNTFFEPSDYLYTPGWTNLDVNDRWDGLHMNKLGHRKAFNAVRLCTFITN